MSMQIVISRPGPVDMGKLHSACLQAGMSRDAMSVMEGYFGRVVTAYAAPDVATVPADNIATPVAVESVDAPLETAATDVKVK